MDEDRELDPGAIGGRRQPGADNARAPVEEAGGGEAEGFEQAEQLLIDHASHADQHPAHRVLRDAGDAEEAAATDVYGEADHERSSEVRDD